MRRGYTVIELAVAFAVAAVIATAAVLAINAALSRTDEVLADTTLDRVVQAQLGYAAGHGVYAHGHGTGDAALVAALPASLTRDLTVTHGRSTDVDVVSVAVSTEQVLVVAVRVPNGTCHWRTVPPIAGNVSDQQSGSSATVTCRAALLLPPGQVPASG